MMNARFWVTRTGGVAVRVVQHRRSVCGSTQRDIREKLQAFPGGSIDLEKQESGIALLTVNNPARMNALSGTMMLQLEERVQELQDWTEGKALVLRGAAGTFCSGSDLNAVRAIANPRDGVEMCALMQETLSRLSRLPLFSVALVEGLALGGGAELTTACDFRVMRSDAVIRFVHKHMGLVPGWGGAARLVGIVGRREALRLLGGALKVDAGRGKQLGLVDEVLHESRDALPHTERWLEQLVRGPAAVVRALKKVVVSGVELPLEEALEAERGVFGTVWGGPDNLRALAARPKHQ